MGYIEELVKSTLKVAYDNEDVSALAGDDKEYGGEEAAAAESMKGRDLNSILSILNETNSGGGDDPSGTNEYKEAYRAVQNAAFCMDTLKTNITNDSYTNKNAIQSTNMLRSCRSIINDYLHAKSKGIFFKHPITPKGKKRFACMQNASRIIDAALWHYDEIDTTHDNDDISVDAVTANQQKQSSFDVTIQNQKLTRGFANDDVLDEIRLVAAHMGETLFSTENLSAFLTMYKYNAGEIHIKALLMRENTPAANSAVAKAFMLGGPGLSNQLKLAYKLLRQVDTMADELWKGVAVKDKEKNATPPDKELIMKSKKEILKLIRQVNIFREINARELNRYEDGRFI